MEGRTEGRGYRQKRVSLGAGGSQQGGDDGAGQGKVKKEERIGHMWSLVPVSPALRGLRQKDCLQFEASLGRLRFCLKKKK